MKTQLLDWFEAHLRPLPWRQTRDPYPIWISEVMLQQTTVEAVKPYYARFLKAFPPLTALADAPVEDVLEQWAGLGYYSRARNLHKSAKAIVDAGGFPKTAAELIQLPGFGPYTSRAVSSQAFGESVGVLDGNVIRFLCRFHNLAFEWWRTQEKEILQALADDWVQGLPADRQNQALMELGATICTPTSPSCLLCPVRAECEGFQTGVMLDLPLSKPKKQKQIWLWTPERHETKTDIAITRQQTAPFLKDQWLLPGQFQPATEKPRQFSYRHSITHHDIFVIDVRQFNYEKPKSTTSWKWISKSDFKKYVPVSLADKAFRSNSTYR